MAYLPEPPKPADDACALTGRWAYPLRALSNVREQVPLEINHCYLYRRGLRGLAALVAGPDAQQLLPEHPARDACG